jgi:phosphate starvation-inducible PhoH-like protein
LQGIEGIAFIYFSERDVVRHPLVQEIIKAYAAASDEDHARPRARRRR